MENIKRKRILIVIIVICLSVTAVILFASIKKATSSKLDVFENQDTWVKCRNPKCKAEYQVNKKWYYSEIEKLGNPMLMETQGVECRECNLKSAFIAIKCPKCEVVFGKGASGPRELADRCPSCGYSELEARRK